jgi:hypothetical protein
VTVRRAQTVPALPAPATASRCREPKDTNDSFRRDARLPANDWIGDIRVVRVATIVAGGRTIASGHEGSPVSARERDEASWGVGAFDGEFADRVPNHVPNSAILTRANCTELH